MGFESVIRAITKYYVLWIRMVAKCIVFSVSVETIGVPSQSFVIHIPYMFGFGMIDFVR